MKISKCLNKEGGVVYGKKDKSDRNKKRHSTPSSAKFSNKILSRLKAKAPNEQI